MNMKFLSYIVLAISFYHINAHDEDLPNYITPCDYNDNNLETCIKTEIVKVLPQFAKGVPEYGVKSLDPFPLDDIVIDQNNLKVNFFKPKMSGLSKVTLTEFKLDVIHLDADCVLGFVGDIEVKADYVADGKILILPIQGKGGASIIGHNIAVNITSKVKHFKDNENHSHMKLTLPAYKYDIESTVFNLENLFNGNKELADTTLKFANENWKQLMDDLAPPVIKQIATAIIKNINLFLSKVGFEKMIKNSPPEA